tara:strand:- start:300 stop:476 length:177 start_codon:yes stop_codon:yes gene_type:complete
MPRGKYKVLTVSPEVFAELKSLQIELENIDPLNRNVSMGKVIEYMFVELDKYLEKEMS